MKIAILTYWGDKGGVYIHVMNIATRVSKLPDVDLHIVALSEKSCTNELFGGTAHFLKRAKSAGANYFYNPFLIRNKIMELDPDLIHIHTTINSHAMAALMLPKRYPIIVTIHQSIEDDIRNRLPPSTRRWIKLKIEPYLEKRLLKKAECIITPSPHMKEYYSTVKNKISVVPNGIDFGEIENSNYAEMDTLHPSILFMGRLEKIKGVDILIRSIPFVANSIPDVHLYIAGSGEEEGKLKHLVKKLDIGANVTFLGFVSEDEKWSYYKSTDLCVVPSVEEPFGIVLLEAMACGKPAIASNVGGIPYIVEDGKTGLLFECGDIEGLTEKVITLLQNKKMREKMGAAGLEKAKEFPWDKIVDKTLILYEKLFSESTKNFKVL